MALTTETMFSYLKDIWKFFGRSFIMCFICVTHTNIFYIELAANSCQIFMSDISRKRPSEKWHPPTEGIIQFFFFFFFFDGLAHHYYMERLAFYALIKYIFKTDLQKDKISCTKNSISIHMQTLSLKCSPEI